VPGERNRQARHDDGRWVEAALFLAVLPAIAVGTYVQALAPADIRTVHDALLRAIGTEPTGRILRLLLDGGAGAAVVTLLVTGPLSLALVTVLRRAAERRLRRSAGRTDAGCN